MSLHQKTQVMSNSAHYQLLYMVDNRILVTLVTVARDSHTLHGQLSLVLLVLIFERITHPDEDSLIAKSDSFSIS
jgi:hypothetical protein